MFGSKINFATASPRISLLLSSGPKDFRSSHISKTANLSSSSPIPNSRTFQPRNVCVFSTSPSIMSSSPGKYEWMVQIPDHANALDKRLAVRPTHLENLKPHIDSGKVTMGGAILGSQPEEGENPDMKGSFMLIRADSEEEVRQFVRNDAYAKGGAWDADNITIWPFRCAVRTAK